ncbi:MAG: hypothetical protein L3J33_01065 [Rhodobacteraceae bacterium]|nr:hypothetical protein [Paracoccaceae bacterium]
MVDKEFSDAELTVLFEDAKAEQPVEIPAGLTERVLADAAKIGAGFVVPETVEKPAWFSRIFAPIGGLGGAFALGAFASLGLVVGLGDAENLYALPVMGEILAVFSTETGAVTPLDTLEFLMAES